MIGFLIFLAVFIVLLIWYAMAGRAWLKQQWWTAKFFAWIEPLEVRLYQKSETVLMGRLMWVGGAIVTLYDSVATFFTSLDLTPVTNRLFSFIPSDLRPLAVSSGLVGVGLLINWLRKRTSKSLDDVVKDN